MSPTALWDSLSLFILNTHFFNEISEAFIILCFGDSISFEKQIQRSLLSAEQLLLLFLRRHALPRCLGLIHRPPPKLGLETPLFLPCLRV